MASLSTDGNGNRTIQFVAGGGKRRSIRLGKVPKKVAESVKLKVEALNAALVARLPLDGETAGWVAGIGDDLAAKLAAVELVPPRASRALGPFLAEYVAGRRADSKPATVVTIARVAADLEAHFGADADLRAVTAEGADRFKAAYQARGLAPATTYRRLKMAKMLFGHAARLGLAPANPFADVRAKNHNPPDRRHYVSPADARKLVDAANPTWRTIVALARFGGLRCPSEVLSLRWEHVDLAAGRMTVTSPKTEHIEGKGYRVVPVFAALRPYLEEAFDLAADGAEYVVGGPQGDRYRAASRGPKGWVNSNLRTPFGKLIRRAGLTRWPRAFHNLRASCETDLMEHHPIHVVTAWVGNTPRIALGHYLQTLDRDFEKAIAGGAESGAVVVQKAVQSAAAGGGQDGTASPQVRISDMFGPALSAADVLCPDVQVAKVGLEPTRL